MTILICTGHLKPIVIILCYKTLSFHAKLAKVPRGVEITDALTNERIGEILSPSDKILVARGGMGATHKNQFKQERGQNRTLNIDLKTISGE